MKKPWLSVGLVTLVACAALQSCSSVRIQDYSKSAPAFYPEEYFDGETRAWGVFYDWKERLTRRFQVQIRGSVDRGILTLKEDFVFDDGETDYREWRIVKNSETSYQGTSPDVVGTATGERAGNALHWRYYLLLKTKSGVTEVFFDDWMFLLDEDRLFNRATVSKFGIDVGEVILFFEKPSNRS